MISSLKDQHPNVHPSVYMAPGAHALGDVTLKENVSVWFNAVLRADNARITIGKNSNVQDGTVVHVDKGFPVMVGENVIIGHNVTLHGCTVEEGALIGMGATVLNGAVVGKGSIVAAGALVPQRAIVEPGTLVAGVPAKPIRKLRETDFERLKNGVDHYVVNAELYRNAGIIEEG